MSAGLGVVVKELKNKSGAQYPSTAVDIGAILAWTVETEEGYKIRSTFGASARNISGDIEIESEGHEWTFDQTGESRYGLGIEVALFETLFIRAGNGKNHFVLSKYMNLGLGLGWQHPARGIVLRLNYAMMEPPEMTEEFLDKDMTDHMIGLVIGKVF